jgi:hypothetical protein
VNWLYSYSWGIVAETKYTYENSHY